MLTVCSLVEGVIRGGGNVMGCGFGAAAAAPTSTGGMRGTLVVHERRILRALLLSG